MVKIISVFENQKYEFINATNKIKGKYFGTILNYLRDGFIILPTDEHTKKELLVEAQYYQLSGLIDILTSQNIKNIEWNWGSSACSSKIRLQNKIAKVKQDKKSVWRTVLGNK